MDEIIANVCRTIACRARLRVLACVARETEIMPTALADKLDMSLGVLSAHLRRLSAAGLIQRRRSGVRCYCVAKSPYTEQTLSGKFGRRLVEVLANPSRSLKQYGIAPRKSDEADAVESVSTVLFEAATAFTHVRRVQLLRRLTKGGGATIETLSAELKMSPPAVWRHLDKLVRRGYAQVDESQWPLCYLAAKEMRTSLHSEVLAIVRAHWQT